MSWIKENYIYLFKFKLVVTKLCAGVQGLVQQIISMYTIWKSKYLKWSWIMVCTSIKIISMQTIRKDLCWNNYAINDTTWNHTLQCSRSREILIMHDTCLTNRFSEAKWKAVRMAGNQNLNYWAMELSLKMSSLESIFPKEVSQNILVPLCDFFIFFLF